MNSIINPKVSPQGETSVKLFKRFLRRKQKTSNSVPSTLLCPPAIFGHFLPVIKHMKPSTSPNDAIPSQIIKDAIKTIGPSILVIINICLVSGTV